MALDRLIHAPFATLLLAPLALASPGQTWTVDDNGPANFASVDSAQAAVAAGDVLLVQPGNYPAFHLTKQLAVLGPAAGPKPVFKGLSTITNVPSFILAGVSLERLSVSGSTGSGLFGRGLIDACSMSAPTTASALSITSCQNLIMSRCDVQGQDEGDYIGGTPALVAISASTMTLVSVQLSGGSGASPDASDGQHALSITGSWVLLAGSTAVGGSGGDGGFCVSCGGDGGDALHALNSTVIVRGASIDKLIAGQEDFGGAHGNSIQASNCTLVYSGVEVTQVSTPGSTVHLPLSPEPFLEIGGSDVPGLPRRALLYGPDGAPGFLVFSLVSGFSSLPAYEPSVWLNPAGIFLVKQLITQGGDAPKAYDLIVPPLAGLEGLTLWAQALFPTVAGTLNPGAMMLTNASDIALRF